MSKKIRLSGRHAVGDHQFAIVDDDMFDELNRYAWKAKPNGSGNNVYAIRTQKSDGVTKDVRMHREVLGYLGSLDIDHINHNSLDNRRCNLRVATRSENMKNTRVSVVSGECRQCGVTFQREAMISTRLAYCGDACAKEASRAFAALRRGPSLERKRRLCWHCGDEFETAKASQRFCTEKCKKSAKWIRQREAKELPPSAMAIAEYCRRRRAMIKDGTWKPAARKSRGEG